MSGGFDFSALNNQNIKSFEQEGEDISGENIKVYSKNFFHPCIAHFPASKWRQTH